MPAAPLDPRFAPTRGKPNSRAKINALRVNECASAPRHRTVSVRIVAAVTLKGRVDFGSGRVRPSLRVAKKIIDDDIHDLLTDNVLWQTNHMGLCKRVDRPNDEGDARRSLECLIGHFAKFIEVIAV